MELQEGFYVEVLQFWKNFCRKFCCAVTKKNDVFTKRSSDETRSQDSVHASLQFAAGTALTDTASSVCHAGRLPGGSLTVTSRAPNVAYLRGMAAARACSASPGLRRSPSPLGLSVAQQCAQHWWNKARQWAISGMGLHRARNVPHT